MTDIDSNIQFLSHPTHWRSRNFKDITGQQFGLLTVRGLIDRPKPGVLIWLCECSCGNTTRVRTGALGGGHVQSCGCLNTINRRPRNYEHKKCRTQVHTAWVGMRARCYNPKNPTYKYYGGRGITVCPRWRDSFENFYADMGDPPEKGLSLDRIDVNGNYEPNNCRWATHDVQVNNRRVKRLFEYKGRSQTLRKWCNELGLPFERMRSRICKSNWTVERAFTEPRLERSPINGRFGG